MDSIHPIVPVVQEAAALALRYFRRADLRGEHKPDGSLVTEADKAIDGLLVPALEALCPSAAIVSEERKPIRSQGQRYTILVDPIDGTSAYASGVPGFCISVGVLDHGKPVAGIVSAPAWGMTWMCDVDPESPLLCDGEPVKRQTTAATFDRRTTALVDSKLHRNWSVDAFPGRCRSFGSTALHLSLLAGSASFAIAHTGRVHAWDLAGAHALLERAGLLVRTVQGAPIDYESFLPDGVVQADVLAGHPEHIEAFRACLSER